MSNAEYDDDHGRDGEAPPDDHGPERFPGAAGRFPPGLAESSHLFGPYLYREDELVVVAPTEQERQSHLDRVGEILADPAFQRQLLKDIIVVRLFGEFPPHHDAPQGVTARLVALLRALFKLLQLLLIAAPRGLRIPVEVAGPDRAQGRSSVLPLRRVPGAPDLVPAVVQRLLSRTVEPPPRMLAGNGSEVRAARREEPAVSVTPNHVMWAASHQIGYSAGPPQAPIEGSVPGIAAGASGEPVVIAVLDGGVDETRPWFGSPAPVDRLDPTLDAPDPAPADGSTLQAFTGHGTFVAGAALAEAYAQAGETTVNRPVRILSVRVSSADGYMSDEQSALGLRRLHDAVTGTGSRGPVPRPDVIVLAFGGWVHDGTSPAMPLVSAAVEELLADPAMAGTVIVASAGNEGFDDRPVYPASLPGEALIGVGATVGSPTPARADFSNAGSWVDACATGGFVLGPFVQASNVAVRDVYDGSALGRADFSGTAVWSGTSMSAALVAGRIAREIATSDGTITGLDAWRRIVSATPSTDAIPGIGLSVVVRDAVAAQPLRPV